MPTASPKFVDASEHPRRHRTKSQPIGQGVELTDRVRRVLGALRRHHVLPTPLLFPFWAKGEERAWYPSFQRVMTRLFHEEKTGGPYVVRPGELNPDFGAKCEPAWYALSPEGLAVASSLTSHTSPAPRKDGWFHRAMGACIGASFELGASRRGFRYMPLEELLSLDECPESTRRSNEPLVVKLPRTGRLEPDDLFGIHYVGTGKRYFAREDDRGTESFTRADKLQNSVKEKLDRYIELFQSEAYLTHWGLRNLKVLFITTQPGRIPTMLKYLEGKPYADRFLFKALPEFAPKSWTAPRAPLEALYEPWTRVGAPFDLSKA